MQHCLTVKFVVFSMNSLPLHSEFVHEETGHLGGKLIVTFKSGNSSLVSFLAAATQFATDARLTIYLNFLSQFQMAHHPVQTAGEPLLTTTARLIVDWRARFHAVMTSELPTHFLFAAMACATIGSALLGDLIILPALLAQFAASGNDGMLPAEADSSNSDFPDPTTF